MRVRILLSGKRLSYFSFLLFNLVASIANGESTSRHILVIDNGSLRHIDPAALGAVGDSATIGENGSLESVDVESLKNAENRLTVIDNASLNNIDLNGLIEIGKSAIQNNDGVQTIDLNAINTEENELTIIDNTSLHNLDFSDFDAFDGIFILDLNLDSPPVSEEPQQGEWDSDTDYESCAEQYCP